MANAGFWDRVKAEIDTQNTKQEWVAEKTKINLRTLENWIYRNILPNAEAAQKIASTLGITVEYLVTGKPPSGLSEKSLEIALAAESLSIEGRDVALNQVRALQSLYPLENSVLSNSG